MKKAIIILLIILIIGGVAFWLYKERNSASIFRIDFGNKIIYIRMKGREYPVSNNGNALSDGVNSYELKNGIFYVKKNGVVLRSSQLDSVKMGKI